MSDDIVAFVKARLDEDERFARLTHSGEWTFDQLGQLLVNQGQTISKIANLGVDSFGRHIARHDPARVLREVEAKRRILGEYERFAAERRRAMNGWDTAEISPIVAALAAVWSGHPDYKAKWRP